MYVCMRVCMRAWLHCRYVVCVDTSGACFVLALVRIAHDAFNMTQLLAVAHPELLAVEVQWRGKVRHGR